MTRSKSNVSEALATALRILSRSDKTEAELSQRLARFGFTADTIEQVLERCRDYGYLNDERYAAAKARSLLRSGKSVGHKAALDLRRRGISDELTETAMEQARNEYPEEELLKDLLERRFANFAYASADEKTRRRVIGFFQRRGFSLASIFRVIRGED